MKWIQILHSKSLQYVRDDSGIMCMWYEKDKNSQSNMHYMLG